MNKVSDYIDYDKASNKAFKLLNDNKRYRIGFYILTAINTGLRVSDLLNLRFESFDSEKLVVEEKKTGKRRIITLNAQIQKGYSLLVSKLETKGISYKKSDYIFTSQKSTIYCTQSLNHLLKQIFNTKHLQISTHSFRKSFGRRVYENHNENENALVLLSDIFSHSNVSITRRYLGIRQETIDNVYLNL